jgi:hypothetical protein
MERLTKFFTSLGGVLTSLAAVVGGAVALYVAFSGGGDQSSTGPNTSAVVDTTSNTALADWRTQVEDLCQDAERRANALGPNPVDQTAQIIRVQELIPILDALTNGIRAMDEPDEVRSDAGRLVEKLDQQVERAQSMVNAYQIGDFQTAEAARLELQGLSTDVNRVAAELGLKRCVDLG